MFHFDTDRKRPFKQIGIPQKIGKQRRKPGNGSRNKITGSLKNGSRTEAVAVHRRRYRRVHKMGAAKRPATFNVRELSIRPHRNLFDSSLPKIASILPSPSFYLYYLSVLYEYSNAASFCQGGIFHCGRVGALSRGGRCPRGAPLFAAARSAWNWRSEDVEKYGQIKTRGQP